MFKIEDGREYFTQWDINRRLIIDDATVNQVHFCNKTDECALIVEVYTEGGARYANVPNILLQESWTIRAYAYCNGCYTKQSKTFKVMARSKPADYVYTETEIKSWDALEEEIKEAIEYVEKTVGDIDSALNIVVEEQRAIITMQNNLLGGGV